MEKTNLKISRENLEQLLHFAEQDLPNESAALLFGRSEDNSHIVTHIEYVQNVSDSKIISFSVNPEEQYRIMIEAESRSEYLIAIFHSHPASPYPSSRDQRNMQLNPVVWLIASKTSGNWIYKAFILEEKTPLEIQIELV